ncbi:sensor histidine kinase [Streptomyces sp. NPDC051907]|uniref:sensor histidine kinase n=1 Tax=Streptomyces sp. NPDC051907 TaxID=3155284 RepID=UPI00343535B9
MAASVRLVRDDLVPPFRADRVSEGRAALKLKKPGRLPEEMGPPNGYSMLPWLLMGMGSFSNLLQGETPNPWIGGIGLLAFNSLYIGVVFRAFDKDKREAPATHRMLIAMTAVTCALAIVYGGSWLLFFPLLGLAAGSVLRGRRLAQVVFALSAAAGTIAGVRDGWGAINVAYGTFISGMVTAAILALSETVRELRATRQELARTAVEKERLRFSRDLHDLLGHTLSVIVVKSEAARRLAPRDLDAALAQITDIESVGRQALTEIREAVTGYREASLANELDRARSALTAAGIAPVVRQSGPPLEPQTAALLGWVVREAVTNAVRHSGASTCEITLESTPERAHLTVTDDGHTAPSPLPTSGTGLKGLTERLSTAGGSLRTTRTPDGGFRVSAELPVDGVEESVSGETALHTGG